MAVMETSAEVIGQRYVCDECGEGEMVADGNIMLTCDPPKYPHKCVKCGHKDNFHIRYPTVIHRLPPFFVTKPTEQTSPAKISVAVSDNPDHP